MKNIIYALFGILLITSCETNVPCECPNTSNGFVAPGQSVNIGSESTVDVFKKRRFARKADDKKPNR